MPAPACYRHDRGCTTATRISRAGPIVALSLSLACSGSDGGPPVDPCAPGTLTGPLGCEFYPTVTANPVDGDFAFGIAVVNPGTAAAQVRVEGGALGAPLELGVGPASSESRTLPWVDVLKACSSRGAECQQASGSSVLAVRGAYRVTSTRPVAVYQFSPIVGELAGVGAGSADATAVPPVHALGTSYLAASWGPNAFAAGVAPGLLAVTAVEDATTVTVTTTAAVASGDLLAFAPGAPASVALNRGDVLELLAYGGDLTGSSVTATKRVQVIGGHFCARVPDGVGWCDHLEEAMPPLSALGSTYVLPPPRVASLPQGKKRIVRFLGTADGTTLAYSTALPGAPASLGRGQFADVETDQAFRVAASQPVLVAEYMEGFEAGGSEGDPSLSVALAVERQRSAYSVFLPPFAAGYADVVAQVGSNVRVNGGDPLQLTPISGTGSGLALVSLGGAYFAFTGDQPFGLSVYGTQGPASYWFVPSHGP